jgi:hypothetical protein
MSQLVHGVSLPNAKCIGNGKKITKTCSTMTQQLLVLQYLVKVPLSQSNLAGIQFYMQDKVHATMPGGYFVTLFPHDGHPMSKPISKLRII